MSFDTGIFTDLDDSGTIPNPTVMARASAIQPPKNMGRFWEDCETKPDPSSNRKFNIYTRSDTPREGVVGAGGWDASATTLLVGNAAGLIKGLILHVENEVMVISSVNLGANQITVLARGAGGSTAATHAADVVWKIKGSAINDVDLKSVESVHEITSDYENYMQTVAEPIDYTRGGELDPRDGLSATMVRTLEEEAMLRVAKNVYSCSIHGLKAEKSGTSPWMTAGLLQQLSDTDGGGRLVLRYNCNGVLTEEKLRAALALVSERGNPDTIYCSQTNKETINGFLAKSSATKVSVTAEYTDTQAGYYVDTYNYEGAILNIKVDSEMPDDRIAIMNMRYCYKGWKKNDPLVFEKQTTLSSRESRAAYNGSFFVEIEQVGYEHIDIYGITQS